MTDGLTDKLTNLGTDWLTDRLTDWLIDRLPAWLNDKLTDLLTDWQSDQLTNWPADWPTGKKSGHARLARCLGLCDHRVNISMLWIRRIIAKKTLEWWNRGETAFRVELLAKKYAPTDPLLQSSSSTSALLPQISSYTSVKDNSEAIFAWRSTLTLAPFLQTIAVSLNHRKFHFCRILH